LQSESPIESSPSEHSGLGSKLTGMPLEQDIPAPAITTIFRLATMASYIFLSPLRVASSWLLCWSVWGMEVVGMWSHVDATAMRESNYQMTNRVLCHAL
jgi:hypothetical protein